jgi:hypothetical protein
MSSPFLVPRSPVVSPVVLQMEIALRSEAGSFLLLRIRAERRSRSQDNWVSGGSLRKLPGVPIVSHTLEGRESFGRAEKGGPAHIKVISVVLDLEM